MSERRRTHRTEVQWCAKILANQSLQSCVVRNIFFLGARLAFSGAADVLDDFELALHQSIRSHDRSLLEGDASKPRHAHSRGFLLFKAGISCTADD